MNKLDKMLHELRSARPQCITFADSNGEWQLEYIHFLNYYCTQMAQGKQLAVKDMPGLAEQLQRLPAGYSGILLNEIMAMVSEGAGIVYVE